MREKMGELMAAMTNASIFCSRSARAGGPGLVHFVAILPFLFASSVASAQTLCSSFVTNQLPNCGFEIGDPPTDWFLDSGTDFRQYPDALGGDYSAGATPTGIIIPTVALLSSCLAVNSSSAYEFGIHVKRSSSFEDCRVFLNSFSDSGCASFVSGLQAPPTPLIPDEWTLIAGSGEPDGPFI